jgi:ABC-2 type transport system permease protein
MAILTGAMVQSILVIFVAVLNVKLLPVALVGAMVYSMFLIGQRVLNEAAYVRIDHKLNELYHASPMSPEAYFLGMSGGIFVAYLPPVLILVVLMEIVHPLGVVEWAALALGMLAVWIFSSTIGYVISTLFRDMKTIWPYSSLLTNLFGIVPPVFYPLALVPSAFQNLALVVPTSAASILAAYASGLQPVTADQALVAGVSLAVESAVLFVFGIYWARRTAREA